MHTVGNRYAFAQKHLFQLGDICRGELFSAAKLLQMYRGLLPDWGITVTSYNSGVGKLQKLVKKYRVKSVEGVISLPQPDGLGFAGQNFYAEVLAANIVEAYKEKIFSNTSGPIDLSLVFRGIRPFPKEMCDL